MACDDDVWNAVTAGVKPLKHRRAEEAKSSAKDPASRAGCETPQKTTEHIPDRRSADPGSPAARALPELAAGDLKHIDGSKAKKLKRGELPMDARLDLHGMTQAQAQKALENFILMSAASGHRCVLVITGKGEKLEGTLRTRLPEWLNLPQLRPHVLAFTTAQPKDGGAGAWYLYLKRQ